MVKELVVEVMSEKLLNRNYSLASFSLITISCLAKIGKQKLNFDDKFSIFTRIHTFYLNAKQPIKHSNLFE